MPGNHLLQQSKHIGCFDCPVSMKHRDSRVNPTIMLKTRMLPLLGFNPKQSPKPDKILVFSLLRQAFEQTSAALSRLEW